MAKEKKRYYARPCLGLYAVYDRKERGWEGRMRETLEAAREDARWLNERDAKEQER